MEALTPLFTTIGIFLLGLLIKYLPGLKSVPNNMIPWVGLLLGILQQFVAPTDAHAAGWFGGAVSAAWRWALPPLQVILARLLYETFTRPTLEMTGQSSRTVMADEVKKTAMKPGGNH